MMRVGWKRGVALAVMCGAAGVAAWQFLAAPRPLDRDARLAMYDTPLPAPDGGLQLYFLGHSLIGPDIPALVTQLADMSGKQGAGYNSQLGWGASLRDHWEPDRAIAGFEAMNRPPAHRPARAALESGAYDALVLTEMIGLEAAIRWHDSGRYTARWAQLARKHAPDIRIYKYETWHPRDTTDDWLARIDRDAEALWEGTILAQAKAYPGVGTIHVIPAGRAMAAFVRALRDRGGVAGMRNADALFAMTEDGTRDGIHVSDLGAYLVALVHYATLYQADPRGLPHRLSRADGTQADAPSAEAAALMQQVAWDVVRRVRATGLAQATGDGA